MCVQLSFKNEFSKWLNVETCEVTFWIRRVTMSDMYRVRTPTHMITLNYAIFSQIIIDVDVSVSTLYPKSRVCV